MKSIGVFIFSLVISLHAYTQSKKEFQPDSQVETVYAGDTVLIHAEYATIFSKEITTKIDNNRLVYDSLRRSYRRLIGENKRLINALQASQAKLERLVANNDSGAASLGKIGEEIENLTGISEELEETNSDFEETNVKFNNEIQALKEQNKLLKKQIKKVRWQQWKGYIASGLAGIAIGIGIMAAG